MKRNTKISMPVDRSSVTSDNVVGGSRQKKPSRRLVETALGKRNLGKMRVVMTSKASQEVAQNKEESSALPPATPRSSARTQRIGSVDVQGFSLVRRRTTRSTGLTDLTLTRNEEDLMSSSESNGDSRNNPGYESSDVERDAAQDNDDDGASGIEAARAFLLRQDTASTSVSRQASIIATSSQSSQTSVSSPEAQGPSPRRQTRSMDPDSGRADHPTKRQRTSLLGKRLAEYNSPYPTIQISATPERATDDGLERRVLRSNSRSVAPVTAVTKALPGDTAMGNSLPAKETRDPHSPSSRHASNIASQDVVPSSNVESSGSAQINLPGPKDANTPRRTRRSAQTRPEEPENQPLAAAEIQRSENTGSEIGTLTSHPTGDTTSSSQENGTSTIKEQNVPNFPVDLISKDIDDLVAETQRDIEREEDLRKMVDFTIHRLETLKSIRDDPSQDLYSDKPWQDLLFAVGDYITAKDPVPDKMMTEWHQLMAEIKLKFHKIEAMKKNLAKIVEENDDHIRKVKSRLDLHYQIRQRTNVSAED